MHGSHQPDTLSLLLEYRPQSTIQRAGILETYWRKRSTPGVTAHFRSKLRRWSRQALANRSREKAKQSSSLHARGRPAAMRCINKLVGRAVQSFAVLLPPSQHTSALFFKHIAQTQLLLCPLWHLLFLAHFSIQILRASQSRASFAPPSSFLNFKARNL